MGHVLVIDDSVSVCLGIEQALVKHGLVIRSERLGESARKAIDREVPDLIICDVVLPDVDGLELCAELKSAPETADIPIMVISGLVDDRLRRQAKEVGAADLLEKPFEEDALHTRVQELLLAYERTRATARAESDKASALSLDPAAKDAIGQLLKPLWIVAEWRATALISAEGHLLYCAGQDIHSEWASELAQLASATRSLAHHSTKNPWKSLVIESEPGITLLSNLSEERILAVVLDHHAGLGMVRWHTKRLLPSLEDLVTLQAPVVA